MTLHRTKLFQSVEKLGQDSCLSGVQFIFLHRNGLARGPRYWIATFVVDESNEGDQLKDPVAPDFLVTVSGGFIVLVHLSDLLVRILARHHLPPVRKSLCRSKHPSTSPGPCMVIPHSRFPKSGPLYDPY